MDGTSAGRRPRHMIPALGVLAAISVGAVVGVSPTFGVAALIGAALLALVLCRPSASSFIYLGVAPLIVGVDRGAVLPSVRLNEALLSLLVLGVALGPGLRWLGRGCPLTALHRVDGLVVLLAVFSSASTMAWMLVQATPLTSENFTFALVLWKYLALYAMVRVTLRSARQVQTAITVVLTSSAIVAVLGILQAVQLRPFPQLLSVFVSADDADKIFQYHAKSTIGASIPFADVMAVCAALAFASGILGMHRKLYAFPLTSIFVLAALSSGEVSGIIAVVLALAATGAALRRLQPLVLAAVPTGLVALLLLQSTVAARLEAIDPQTGLPQQWVGENGRLDNLSTFFLPRLAEGFNWLFGVETSGRVAAPEPWREWVWIESGYVWLLWNGGVPLLLVFCTYAVLVFSSAREVLLRPGGELGYRVAAAGALAGASLLAVLMCTDPHLTMRGVADVLFPLVAMTVTAATARSTGSRGDHAMEGQARDSPISRTVPGAITSPA